MNEFLAYTQTAGFIFSLLACIAALLILIIINIINTNKLKKEYKSLVNLLGNGQDFNEVLNKYVNDVEIVSHETMKLKAKTDSIQKNIEKCVQKVGVVRYNAYLDTGSDLCFAVALLDFEDNGVVINGIYSRDNTTTTYAKPIEHGKSKYTLVEAEEAAIEKAKHNAYKCFLDLN